MTDEFEKAAKGFADSYRKLDLELKRAGLPESEMIEIEPTTIRPMPTSGEYRGKTIMMPNFHKMRPDPVPNVNGKVNINGTDYPVTKDGLEFSHLNENNTPVYVDPWHPVLPWERFPGT